MYWMAWKIPYAEAVVCCEPELRQIRTDGTVWFVLPISQKHLQLNNGMARSTRSAIMPAWLKASGAGHPYCGPRQRRLERDIYISNGIKRDVTGGITGYSCSIQSCRVMNSGFVDERWLKSIPVVPNKNYFFHNNGSLKFEKYTDTRCDAPPSFRQHRVCRPG